MRFPSGFPSHSAHRFLSLCDLLAHSKTLVPFSLALGFSLGFHTLVAISQRLSFAPSRLVPFTLRPACAFQDLGSFHLDHRIFFKFPRTGCSFQPTFLRTQPIGSLHFAIRLRISRPWFLSLGPWDFLEVSTHWLWFPRDFPSHLAHWFLSFFSTRLRIPRPRFLSLGPWDFIEVSKS